VVIGGLYLYLYLAYGVNLSLRAQILSSLKGTKPHRIISLFQISTLGRNNTSVAHIYFS
jgi:hypothetical protein